MILEIPEAVIIDGEKRLENIRGNLPPGLKQFRIKFNLIMPDGKVHDLDVIATKINWEIGLTPKLNLKGRENNRKIFYDLSVKYKILDGTVTLTGSVGSSNINKTLATDKLPAVLADIGEIFIKAGK